MPAQLIAFGPLEAVRGRAVGRPWRMALDNAARRMQGLELTFVGQTGDAPWLTFCLGDVSSAVGCSLPSRCSAIDDEGARRLAAWLPEHLRRLRLDFSGTSVGIEGARAVASRLPHTLDTLHVGFSARGWGKGSWRAHRPAYSRARPAYSGDAIAGALAEGLRRTPGLRTLDVDLDSSGLTVAGACALANTLPARLRNLELDLWACRIGDDGARAVVQRLRIGLRELTLNFSYSDVTDESLRVLARDLPTSVTRLILYFSGSAVTDEGVRALAERLPGGVTFVWLEFAETTVTVGGLRALGRRLCWCHRVQVGRQRGARHLRWKQGEDVHIEV